MRLERHFSDDLGPESLDTVELVMAFEEAFDIEIPDEGAETIRSVQDVLDYVSKHAKATKEEMERIRQLRSTQEVLDYLRKRKKGGGIN